jgi:hypothetical protein
MQPPCSQFFASPPLAYEEHGPIDRCNAGKAFRKLQECFGLTQGLDWGSRMDTASQERSARVHGTIYDITAKNTND